MNNHASELWDTYTDAEKVLWICEKIMGLEVVSEHQDLRRCQVGNYGPRFAIYEGKIFLRSPDVTARLWDPLNNVADAIEAERVLTCSNEEIKTKYTAALIAVLQIKDWKITPDAVLKLTQASGKVRSEAMFLTLNQ